MLYHAKPMVSRTRYDHNTRKEGSTGEVAEKHETQGRLDYSVLLYTTVRIIFRTGTIENILIRSSRMSTGHG